MSVKTRLGVILAIALLVIAFGFSGSLTAAMLPSSPDFAAVPTNSEIAPLADDPSSPASPVRLIFIHHSTGGNWLADVGVHERAGGLGRELMNNNYYVSATNYGWTVLVDGSPISIGDSTDIGHWWDWFRGPDRDAILAALYTEDGQNVGDYGTWPRLSPAPGGENEIIMFKSCYPNSHLGGNPGDPPTSGANPLRGQDAWSGDSVHNVANAKGIYNDILEYFATRQDKLFIVITAPPLLENDGDQPTDAAHAANARAFNDWLVNDWLDSYPYNNVAVFDFYNVLTSNGGDPDTHDLGQETGNHHRWWSGAVQHIHTVSNNLAAYASGGDSHPTDAGGQKATAEFVPLLNVYYNRWRSGTGPTLTLTAPDSSTIWPIDSQQQIRWTTTGTVSQVNLYYSIDNVTTTITSAMANTGLYTWTTPVTPTTSARVRVESVISPTTVYDVSDNFRLYDPSTLFHKVYLPIVLRSYTTSPGGPLIQPTDLTYLGAFRLPDVPPGTPENIGWEWSGASMTYYPDGDPGGPADGYPGSIFGTGHNWNQYVSEISIPVPIISPDNDVDDLNTATTLQDFQNIRGNLFGEFEIPRVGLEYLPAQGSQTTDKLYFCWAQHMGEGETNPSHGWCDLDLSDPQTAGAWRIGNYWNYVTTDYIFAIPQAWADANTPGMYLVTGRFRDGGQGTQGPSLIAYGPWNEGNPPPPGSTLSAVPLLFYGNVYTPGSPSMNNYHHSDEWAGGTWLTAGGKSAVIFVGTKGTGNCWYGCSDGTVWPDEPPYPPECPERGWWSTGFVGQIVFYDPADLAAVARGDVEPYEPQPYATLEIDEPLFHIESSQQKEHLGAASFDREHGLLYVFEPLADGDKSLVHVWRVE